MELDDPYGYGRVLLDKNKQVCGIIEEADATESQKQIKMINTGIYCIQKRFLLDALPKIQSDNAQGELYLTDIMAIGYSEHKKMVFGSVPIINKYWASIPARIWKWWMKSWKNGRGLFLDFLIYYRLY